MTKGGKQLIVSRAPRSVRRRMQWTVPQGIINNKCLRRGWSPTFDQDGMSATLAPKYADLNWPVGGNFRLNLLDVEVKVFRYDSLDATIAPRFRH